MRRVAKRLWPSARTDSERVMRAIAGRALPRKCLNRLYDGFSDRRRRVFHARFAKIFRDHRPPVAPGTWRVRFAGREVRIPLGRETMWLDWDCALSVLGHDAELKATYAALLASDNPPRCVFDVGANYGVHSLLLLAHGVQVFFFEPNPRCHQFSRRLETVNDVAFILEATAMGAECGMVELAYPETETWLGTTSTEVASALAAEHELYRVQVPCTTLDAYVDRENRVPDLIKLDTEGGELSVLRGGVHTLKTQRPLLLFECGPCDSREQLWTFLHEAGYVVTALPLRLSGCPAKLHVSAFCESRATNFGALPRERAE